MKRNMACRASGMTVFVLSLLFAGGCATVSSNRTVEYGSLTDKSFSAVSRPAQLSKETDEALYAKGYARLGSMMVDHILERCTSADSKAEKCEKFPQPTNPTDDLLREAANRGGEVVTLLEDAKSEKRATAGKRCIRTETVRSYSTMVYDRGRYVPGTTRTTQCTAWEQTLSSERHVFSVGIVWRLDRELAKNQKDRETLAQQAAAGHLAGVHSLVEQGVRADSLDPGGIPAVAWAAASGNQDLVAYLISKGAKLDSNDYLVSPLEMASEEQNSEMMRYLLSKGANVDRRNKAGSTPLMNACLGQKTDAVRVLLDAGANVNAKNDNGITPLMAAILGMKKEFTREDHNMLGQDPEIPRMLLEKGANADAADKGGKRALEHAAETVEFGKSAAFYLNWKMGAFGYLDKKGKWAVKPSYQGARRFSEGLAAVVDWYYDSDSAMTGFMDRTGRLVIPPRYHSAGDFHEGMAAVCGPWQNLRRKCGYIDKSGRLVVELIYGSAAGFSEGLASVEKDGKIGYINKRGDVVITPMPFDEHHKFQNGVAVFGTKDGAGKKKYGIINKTGAWVVAPQFDMLTDFREGLAGFRQIVDGKKLWGLLDERGRIVAPAQFHQVGYFSDGLATYGVMQGDKLLLGYVDRTGRVAIPPRFKKAYVFSNGTARVEEAGGTLQVINKKGEVVAKAADDEPGLFSDGLALVTKQATFGKSSAQYIDRSGAVAISLDDLGSGGAKWSSAAASILTLTFDVTPRIYAEPFSEELAPVRVQGAAFLKAWRSGPQ